MKLHEPQEQSPVPLGEIYKSPAELEPDALPYANANLILSGSSVPVTMSRTQKGDSVTFKLESKDEMLEEEFYQADDKSFRFIGITGETFDPAIPLIRYPFRVGESWDWTGYTALGLTRKKAKATLTSATDTLNLAAGVFPCILVTADLEADTGGGMIGKRSLKFWFEPKKGLVKRDLGSSTTREPRPKPSS